ncbi:MAG: radical SAM protein [Anaerolineales bacterium]
MGITPIIKPVSTQCNLHCTYCYHGIHQENQTKSKGVMSVELTKRIIDEVSSTSTRPIKLIWHGGEPLLAGIDYYQQIQDYQSLLTARTGRRYINAIQTNGTLLTEKSVDFLLNNKWGIGISLDGPQMIHDNLRKTRTNKGSFAAIKTGIDRIKSRGGEFTLNAVITRYSINYSEEIFYFLLGLSKRFDISPLVHPTATDSNSVFCLQPKEFGRFATEFFDFWWRLDDPSIRIRCLENAVIAAMGATPNLCSLSGECAKYIAFDSNGDVYPCGRFVGNENFRLGNIESSSLREIINNPTLREFEREILESARKCKECDWFFACHSGCTYDKHKSGEAVLERTPLCQDTRMLFSHARRRVMGIRGDFIRAMNC